MKKPALDDDWSDVGVTTHPPSRTWSRASLILIVVAFGAETVGKSHIGAGLMGTAKSSEAISRAKEFAEFGMDEFALEKLDHATRLKELANLNFHRAGFLELGGMSLFVFALGCFGLSRYLGESGSSVAFSLLSILYVLWLMMLV
jgi:hypothetical protein